MAYYVLPQQKYGTPLPAPGTKTIPYQPYPDYKPQIPGPIAPQQSAPSAPSGPTAPPATPAAPAQPAAPALPTAPAGPVAPQTATPAPSTGPAAPTATPSTGPAVEALRGTMGLETMGGSGGGLDVSAAEGGPEGFGGMGRYLGGQAALRQGIGNRVLPVDTAALAGLRRIY